jgi:acetyl esterase/lipase
MRNALYSVLVVSLAVVAIDARQAKPDVQMQAVLDQLAALGGKPIETLTPAEARKQPTPADAVKALLKKQGKSTAPEPVAKVEDRVLKGPGGTIPIRIYWPAGAGPFPAMLYIHGGGWVIATLDTYDSSARALANATQSVVVSTHYRQGPEAKFPAAHDDVFAAYRWMVDNASSINASASRPTVAGESAGGNLALNVAMRARDEKFTLPVHQLLVYPIAGSDTTTPSYVENAMAKPLNKPIMEWFFKHYLRGQQDWTDPRIDLVKTANLKGLPPATIINAQIDPLRSEGEMLAKRLRDAGVTVRQRTYDGVTHEFFGMGAVLDKAKDALQFATAGLRGQP